MESLHSNFLSSPSFPIPSPSLSSSSSRLPFPFPLRRRSPRLRRIHAVHSTPKPQTLTKILTPLELARSSLSLLIFSLSIASLPFPSRAIAAPVAASATADVKSRRGSKSSTREHQFSKYTKRLLAAVAVLLERIEEVKSGRGEMSVVRAALKEVKRKRKEIQGEVLEELNSELRELRREKAELVKKSGELIDSGLAAEREKDRILKGNEEVKGELERLESVIGGVEEEYNGLWEKIGEIEDRILRKETLTYSVAIRELGFIERESQLLVERFSGRLRQGRTERMKRNTELRDWRANLLCKEFCEWSETVGKILDKIGRKFDVYSCDPGACTHRGEHFLREV